MFVLVLLMCQCPVPIPAEPEVSRVAPLIAAIKSKDSKARSAAIEQLGKMGPAAWDAVPDLIELMDDVDEGTRFAICLVLQEIGPKSVPSLDRALGSHEPARRRHAAQALLEMARFHETAPLVVPTIPTLTAVALRDSDGDARLAATGAIALTRDKKAVAALSTILKKGGDDARLEAAEGLRNLGPMAKPAVPALLELIDEKGQISSVAWQALVSIGDADTAAEIAKLLGDAAKSKSVRCSAAWALARMPSQSAIAVPALIRVSHDPDAEIRECVASGLKELGTDAGEAAPALRRLLSDEAPKVRIAAAVALYAVRGSDDEAIKTLVRESRGPDYHLRTEAALELGKVGKQEKAAIEALIANLRDEEPEVRRVAVKELEAVGRPAAVKAMPALEKLLDDPDPNVRAAAKEALAGLTSK
jgi:HEAT repeat protein